MNKSAKKAGLPPGSVIYVGEKKVQEIKITILDYDKDTVQEKQVQHIEDCFPFKDTASVTWINVDGLHNVQTIEKIGERFDIHPLIQEDIVHLGQRPKLEDFDSYIFLVVRMLYLNEKNIIDEQLSVVFGSNYVITFQEHPGDVFDLLKERIRNGKYRIRKSKTDYLAYSIMDTVVDNYFILLEKFGEKIEDIEEELLVNPSQETLQKLHLLKREILSLRRSVWPLREIVNALERTESNLIQKSTKAYLRDIYDHTIQVIDTIESYRDIASGMMDTYLSSVSNRMNEVMKVLTMIATVFIPLTFIAGIYGMNFEYIPELKWHWSYPVLWLVMIVIAVAMTIFFRKKKWL